MINLGKIEKIIKKLELILAGVMLPTMIIFVFLELDRLMTGTETDYLVQERQILSLWVTSQ